MAEQSVSPLQQLLFKSVMKFLDEGYFFPNFKLQECKSPQRS